MNSYILFNNLLLVNASQHVMPIVLVYVQ